MRAHARDGVDTTTTTDRRTVPSLVDHMNSIDYYKLMWQDEINIGRKVETGYSCILADYIAGLCKRVNKFDLEEERFISKCLEENLQGYIQGFHQKQTNHISLIKRSRDSFVDLSEILEKWITQWLHRNLCDECCD